MAGKHVVVTLTPVYLPDTLPFRTLTLFDDSEVISIGRASKSESKKLIPSHNNAWFDSRVMSRDHAQICAYIDEKKVVVSDNGSMHGTYLNDLEIAVAEETEIVSGDILTFGSEVTRWPKDGRPRDPSNPFALDTFPPLKVRCECQWFDDNDDESAEEVEFSHETSKNSFSVPDEYDDEGDAEAIPETAPNKSRVFSPIPYTVPSDAEDSEDYSEEEEQDPKSSPPTSNSDETKESGSHVDQNDAEVKPSAKESNRKDLDPESVLPSAEHECSALRSSGSSESARSSDLGCQERPIDVDEGLSTHYVENWAQNEEEALTSPFSKEERTAGEQAIDSIERSVEEPGSGAGDRSVEEYRTKALDTRLDTSALLSSSHEQPYVETDSDGQRSDGDGILEKDRDNQSFAKLAPASYSVSRKEDEPVARDAGSPQLPAASSNNRLGSLGHLNPLGERREFTDYDLVDWPTPAFGSLDFHPRAPSPSDKALAKPLETEYMDRNNSFTSNLRGFQQPSLPPARREFILQEQTKSDEQILGKDFSSMPSQPYTDGPFQGPREAEVEPSVTLHSSRSKEVSHCGPLTFQAPQPPRELEQTPPWHRHDSLSHFSPYGGHRKDMERLRDSELARNMYDYQTEAGRRVAQVAPDPVARVSISDIVAESDREFNMRDLGKRLKRKASEMEEEPQATADGIIVKDVVADGNAVNESLGLSDSIPDAQPQNVLQEEGQSASQLSELTVSKPTKEGTESSDQEPPRKRMKMTTPATNASRPRGNFTKYAATALAGAVVGGVGAIAALIALPPEFFA